MKSRSIHQSGRQYPIISRFFAFFLACLPITAWSDALSELPQAWKVPLQAIAEADLSGAEPLAQKVIADQRDEVARLLLNADTKENDLAEGYGRLGAFYQVYQLTSAAKISYRNAMQLDPDNFRWIYYAGYLASQSGQHEEAIKLYTTARKLKPDYPPLPLRLGESWLELSRLAEASNALQSAAEKPGLRALALYHLAQIDLLQRHYDQAIEKLEEVLQLDPQADRTHYPLARAWRAKGDNERSRELMASHGSRLPAVEDSLIQELEGLNQGARRFFSQALRASHSQDFTAAVKAFAQGLEIEPENHHARVSYARALFVSGNTAEASRELNVVLQSEPEHTLALFLSAILIEDGGNLSEAIRRYEKVLKQEPDHYGAHFCLANRLFQEADYKRAASHYHAALAANPDIPPARLYELMALKHSGQSDIQILEQLELLTSKHREQLVLRYILIKLLTLSEEDQVKDTERARKLVNELVQEAFIPPHVELQALVAAAIGNFDQAASLQQQVLPALAWMGTDTQQQAEDILAAYQRREMPQVVWYEANQVLRSPGTDARLMFREYLSAVPF